MLRNLNRSFTRGRILGTPHSGVKGADIPPTGDDGPPVLYRSLNLPIDNDNEYRIVILWDQITPATGLTMFVSEDTSFIASSSVDTTYTIPYRAEQNGVTVGTSQFAISFGIATVSADLAAAFNINAPVHGDLAAVFNIMAPVHTDLVATYEVSSDGSSIQRRALVLVGARLRQITDAQLGTGRQPIVLFNGRLKRRAGSEGVPVVLVDGRMRRLQPGETLML